MVEPNPETTILELDALGVRLEVACPPGFPVGELAAAWSRCAPGPDAPRRVVEVPATDLDGYRGPSRLQHVTSHLTMTAVEATAARQFDLHAAGVCAPDGRVVALVGHSGAGKSTAARVLAGDGWGYVTDEIVAVTYDGAVIPFPRPVLLEGPDGGGHKDPHSPDALGLGVCPPHPQLARLVLLDRVEGTREPEVRRLGLVDALLELIPQMSALARRANPLQRLCRMVERSGGVHRITYGEAEQLGPVLAALLDAPDGPAQPWWPVRLPTTRASALMDSHVRRAPFRDAVGTEEEYLVLVDRVPVRLAGIGATVWEECDDAPSVPTLTGRVVEVHGDHPDAARLVADAVAEMVRAQVLGLAAPVPLAAVLDPLPAAPGPTAPGP